MQTPTQPVTNVATKQLQIRISPARKQHYANAAKERKTTMSRLCIAATDKVTGYKEK
jgi:hypothetical protein